MTEQKHNPWELETDDDSDNVNNGKAVITPVKLSDATIKAHEQAIFVLLENSQDPNVRSDFLRLIVTFIDEDLGDIVGMWHRPPTGPHANKIVVRFTSSLKAMTDVVIQANLNILQNRANAVSDKKRLTTHKPYQAPSTRPPQPDQSSTETTERLSAIQRLRANIRRE